MIPTDVIKFFLAHRQHISRIGICGCCKKYSNVIMDVGSHGTRGTSEIKQVLNNVTIKYDIKCINCNVSYNINISMFSWPPQIAYDVTPLMKFEHIYVNRKNE